MHGRANNFVAGIASSTLVIACVDLAEVDPSIGDASIRVTDPTLGQLHDAGASPSADAEPAIDVGPIAADVMREFLERVAPILGGTDGRSGSCGPCHAIPGGIGPAFLAPDPDMLTTLLHYPGLIGASPEASRLYTRGRHEGPELAASDASVVAQWIVDWNASMSMQPRRMFVSIDPFLPITGRNQVDLSLISGSLRHRSITFTSTTVGVVDPSLMLSELTVHTATAGVHIVHPLFSIWSDGAAGVPDRFDSFSGLDVVIAPNAAAELGPGILILPHYAMGARISIAFEAVEPMPVDPTNPPPAVMPGCRSMEAFTTNVMPTFSLRCASCHAGGMGNATAAFDMSGVSEPDVQNQARVCANALAEVDLFEPSASHVFTYATEGSGIVHPLKLESTELEQFRREVTLWIVQER
jgi:hypothetical protein